MWHDAWPPLPPGGHRPPDYPPFTSPGDQLLALGLGASAGAGALVWATGQLAGLVFGHTWLDVSPADVAQVLWQLPQHWSDPALAWPADARGPLPGPTGMYTTLAGLVGGMSGGTTAVLRHLPGRAAGHRPGNPRSAKHAGAVWASGRELRLLTVREPAPGRVLLGRTPGLLGRLLAAEDCHSVLVFGPTGSYKTSALVIPAVLEWSGPLLATSVKPDLLRATMAHRARLGQVLVIDPLGASGVQAARWSPLASCSTWAGAQQMAVMLANAIEQTPTEEQRPEHRFWKTMGTKFLAPMLFAAAVKGLGMRDVLHWLDSREDQQIKDILDAAGVPAALDAWESSQYRTDRAVDSLYATAEEVLHVYANERVSASTEGHDLDLEHFLSGNHTIYLYAPAHQQRLLRPLFEAITQQVVAAAQELAALSPDGMLNPRLGLFLDEAGNCAALSDLDAMQLVHRDNASTPDSLTKARHDDRATLLQSLVGLLALFGAISALRQIRVTREGQITDRYTKAIDQLGNKDALAVRLGGLYALERIARDSVPDRATIAEVLCAYARTAPRPAAATLISLSVRAPDVQAAVTILGRWQARLREAPPNVALQGADLEGAYFGGAQLQRAHFAGAQLQRANFGSAQLQGAYFGGAQLQGASFIEARLEETSFFPVPGRTQADANTSWPEGFDWQAAGIERRDT